jgi:hypothetical protein
MGYYKNLEIADAIELADRKRPRRSTHKKATDVVAVNRVWLTALLAATWLQSFVIVGWLVWAVTR